MDLLLMQEFNMFQWAAILLSGFLVGVSKSGIKGISIIIVSLMATVFGAKVSTGIVLLLFISGDVMAVSYYKHHIKWKQLFRLLPWMIMGIIIASFFGKDIPEELFKQYFSIIIMASIVLLLWKEYGRQFKSINSFFAPLMGLLAGITTMMGNLAGAFSNLYFLSTGLPKNQFIGTAAVLFFIVNLFKLPIHIFWWKTIDVSSGKYLLLMLPMLMLGFYLGLKLVNRFSNAFFRKFIIVVTIITAVLFIFQ